MPPIFDFSMLLRPPVYANSLKESASLDMHGTLQLIRKAPEAVALSGPFSFWTREERV
jgi:hypothetical protein